MSSIVQAGVLAVRGKGGTRFTETQCRVNRDQVADLRYTDKWAEVGDGKLHIYALAKNDRRSKKGKLESSVDLTTIRDVYACPPAAKLKKRATVLQDVLHIAPKEPVLQPDMAIYMEGTELLWAFAEVDDNEPSSHWLEAIQAAVTQALENARTTTQCSKCGTLFVTMSHKDLCPLCRIPDPGKTTVQCEWPIPLDAPLLRMTILNAAGLTAGDAGKKRCVNSLTARSRSPHTRDRCSTVPFAAQRPHQCFVTLFQRSLLQSVLDRRRP